MDKASLFIVLIVLMFILPLAGCQTAPPKPPEIHKNRPFNTKLIWESEPRPVWINEPSEIPGKKGTSEYFIGISGKLSEERDARDDAFVDAVKHAVQFFGVDITIDKNRIMEIKNQKSSEVLDPTVTSIQKDTALSRAFIQGVKAQRWYTRKIGNFVENLQVSSYFEVYVAVSISKAYVAETMKKNKLRLLEEREEKKRLDEIARNRKEKLDEIERNKKAEQKKIKEEEERKRKESLADIADRLVRQLASNLKMPGAAPVNVILGEFTFGDSGCSGAFIEGFKEHIDTRASSNPAFFVKDRFTNLSLSSGWGTDYNLESALAKQFGAAILHGRYNREKGKVIIHAYITGESGRLSAGSVEVPEEKIKKEIVAEGCKKTKKKLVGIEPLKEPGFLFRVWTENSNRTYKRGEDFVVNVKSEKRAYLKMFAVDTLGGVSVLQDSGNSRILKNKAYAIGVSGKKAGVQTIIAVAKTTPFAVKNRPNEEIMMGDFLALFKNIRWSRGDEAEAKLTVTILE